MTVYIIPLGYVERPYENLTNFYKNKLCMHEAEFVSEKLCGPGAPHGGSANCET